MVVFGGACLPELLSQAAAPGTTCARLGFTPTDATPCKVEPIRDDDDALFVLEGKENPFSMQKLHFPDLFHT